MEWILPLTRPITGWYLFIKKGQKNPEKLVFFCRKMVASIEFSCYNRKRSFWKEVGQNASKRRSDQDSCRIPRVRRTVEMEVKNESKSIRKTDLRKVQSHQKERFHQNYL